MTTSKTDSQATDSTSDSTAEPRSDTTTAEVNAAFDGAGTPPQGADQPAATGATGDVRAVAGSLGLADDDLVAMYKLVALARSLDERMWVLNRAGRVPFVISGQGHEGAQVGMTYPLRQGLDWLVPFYRSVASILTFGMTPREIMLAQFAKGVDPSSGGRQMPGHYGVAAKNILSQSSPVGTQLLHAVGIALAAKIRGTGQVAMTSFGDGASNQGDFHEGVNFAAVHKLPVVFVIENNGYAISVPASKQSAIPDYADRAAGYGIPGVVVDGADVLASYRAAKEAIDRARSGGGPTLIEAKVMRLTAHSSDDQQTKYRTAEELEHERSRDPLPLFRTQLLEAGILTPELVTQIEADNREAVDDATRWAEQQPDPTVASATWYVYHEDRPPSGQGSGGAGDSVGSVGAVSFGAAAPAGREDR